MKKIEPPQENIEFVGNEILKKFKNNNFHEIHKNRADFIIKAQDDCDWLKKLIFYETEYISLAKLNKLYDCVEEDTIASVPRDTMNELYKIDFKAIKVLGEDKLRNKLYGLSTEKCPICEAPWGYGEKSLDHILPKSKFPQFSITPINLVVTCNQCNKKKKDRYGKNRNEGVINPYFNDIDLVKYLECETRLEKDNIQPYVKIKKNCLPDEKYNRLSFFFDLYKLGERYSAQVRIYLNEIITEYAQFSIESQQVMIDHIKKEIKECSNYNNNEIDRKFFQKILYSSLKDQLKNNDFFYVLSNLIKIKSKELHSKNNKEDNF